MRMFSKRGATVAAIVGGLVLASTGGAVAGSLVTSKDIKNDTIRSKDVRNGTLGLRDMNTFTKNQIKQGGEQGPAGPAGADGKDGADSTVPGPQGPKGDTGAPGAPGKDGETPLANIEHMSAAGPIVAGTRGVVEVKCVSPDKIAISGGFSIDGNKQNVVVDMDRNTIDSKGWIVGARNNNAVGSEPVNVRAWVICANANVQEPTS